MVAVAGRCRGRFVHYRNLCGCPECRQRDRLRGAFIAANEHAARTKTRNAPMEAVARAEASRDAIGEQWRAWEAGDG